MGEVQTAIYDRLRTDPALVDPLPAGLGFLVADRWLVKGPGPGSSPDAFDAVGRMRRAVVVLDAGEELHPDPRPNRSWELWDAYPVLYLFAEAHRNGRDAIEAAYRAIKARLHGWEPELPSGDRPAVEVPPRRAAVRDDPTYPGNIRSEVRVRASGARRVLAAS